MSNRDGLRCKAMWALGLALWMFDRDRRPLVESLQAKFGAKSDKLVAANVAALNAGHAYGETAEIGAPLCKQLRVAPAEMRPGLYRTVTGGETIALGLVAGASLPVCRCFWAPIPSPRRAPVLHYLARLKEYDVTTFQAEDEIAAICSAIGASYGGKLGVTTSSVRASRSRAKRSVLPSSTELPLVDRRYPARRPVDRLADQDRTVGSLSGGLGPQRRRARSR